jgi:hypothetical protein
MEVSGQRHAPTALTPREKPVTHLNGGWLGTIAGVDMFGYAKISSDRDTNTGRLAPSVVVVLTTRNYRKIYTGPYTAHVHNLILKDSKVPTPIPNIRCEVTIVTYFYIIML